MGTFDGWIIESGVQTFQPLILIYWNGYFVNHHCECPSFNRPLSYSFRSLHINSTDRPLKTYRIAALRGERWIKTTIMKFWEIIMKLRVYACLCVCVFYSVCVKKEGEREHIGPIWYFFILPKNSLKPLQGLNLKWNDIKLFRCLCGE